MGALKIEKNDMIRFVFQNSLFQAAVGTMLLPFRSASFDVGRRQERVQAIPGN